MKKFLVSSAAILSLISGVALAHGMGDMKEPTKEERQKMADMHSKMADCLKSDKPMKECKDDMMKNCKDSMGDDCPMMHMMGHKGGMKGKAHAHGEDDSKTKTE
ncbi:MAG TPA: hypothetical protein VL588_10825 [Bdellovibrionota bacterium]|jgi:hypothetical protein|nr:hypothetical protein [Bdellovibrionota bacterium]